MVNGVSNAISDLSSSTTPSDSTDSAHHQIKKLHVFSNYNYLNLRRDVARGQGEYLASFGLLLEVPEKRREAFAKYAQSQYVQMFDAHDEMTYANLLQLAEYGSEDIRQGLRAYGEEMKKSKSGSG